MFMLTAALRSLQPVTKVKDEKVKRRRRRKKKHVSWIQVITPEIRTKKIQRIHEK